MRVAIYSLTRDRLAFTHHCFETLRQRAGYPFDHFVLDNGSEDGTQEWLKAEHALGRFKEILLLDENVGISHGSNLMLDAIQRHAPYGLICKVDNDAEIVTADILAHLIKCFEDQRRFASRLALSPRVEGIRNQPQRLRVEGRGGYRIGVTGIIGGLFHAAPWEVYREYRYPETLPLAKGQDDAFCGWLTEHGVLIGYVEDLVVNHYLGTDEQAKIFPGYFTRKWKEETTTRR